MGTRSPGPSLKALIPLQMHVVPEHEQPHAAVEKLAEPLPVPRALLTFALMRKEVPNEVG